MVGWFKKYIFFNQLNGFIWEMVHWAPHATCYWSTTLLYYFSETFLFFLIFRSIIPLKLILCVCCEVGVIFIPYGYPDILAPFTEKTCPFSVIHFWGVRVGVEGGVNETSVPRNRSVSRLYILYHLSILMPLPFCRNYCSFYN